MQGLLTMLHDNAVFDEPREVAITQPLAHARGQDGVRGRGRMGMASQAVSG